MSNASEKTFRARENQVSLRWSYFRGQPIPKRVIHNKLARGLKEIVKRQITYKEQKKHKIAKLT